MSKQYKVPPKTNEKEKIFGGIFTWSQVGWIAGFSLIGVIFTLITATFLKLASVIFIFIGAGFGFFFALKTKEDLSFFKYLRLKRKFKKSQKIFLKEFDYKKID